MNQLPRRLLFVSYAQADAETVYEFVSLLNRELQVLAAPVDIWVDREALKPGQQWAAAIEDAILNSVGMLVFVSPASVRSDWVRRELEAALDDENRLIVPVILAHADNLPEVLQRRQWLDLSKYPLDARKMRREAHLLADRIDSWLKTRPGKAPLPAEDVSQFAALAAEGARSVTAHSHELTSAAPNSAFVVHGHDNAALSQVSQALNELGVRPVVLSQIEGSAQSLLQKFFAVSKEARFAIVILSSDDYGASRLQYEADGVRDRALQFRARQNVILELGFFYGQLGWENVFVLLKKPNIVFPNFERPSDLDGAVFDAIDDEGKWKAILRKKLSAAGFQIDAREAGYES